MLIINYGALVKIEFINNTLCWETGNDCKQLLLLPEVRCFMNLLQQNNINHYINALCQCQYYD